MEKIRCHITPLRLDRDARSELDHALRQQLEILRRRRAVALHPAKELAPPGQEARAGGARDGGSAGEERSLHRFQVQAVALEKLESARQVRLFHDIGDQSLIEAPALDHAHLGALTIGEAGHLRVDDREENDALVSYPLSYALTQNQFAFTPAARSNPPSVARSSRIWVSNCSGLIGMGSAPSLAWRSRTSGD